MAERNVGTTPGQGDYGRKASLSGQLAGTHRGRPDSLSGEPARIDPEVQRGGTMRFDAVLFDNGGTLTHRTSPVAAVRALAARLGVVISEEDAARYWRRSKEHGKTLVEEKRSSNLSRTDHRGAYVSRYAPVEEIAPGLAGSMYDEWKTNPLTMVPYPDTPPVLKSFSAAGIPIAIVSNTGWSIDAGYAATGMDAFISAFV